MPCNQGLGLFKDDEQLVDAAFMYLVKDRRLRTLRNLRAV